MRGQAAAVAEMRLVGIRAMRSMIDDASKKKACTKEAG